MLSFDDRTKLNRLKTQVEAMGYEVIEEGGPFKLINGEWSPYYLRPKDTRLILKSALNSLPDVPLRSRFR